MTKQFAVYQGNAILEVAASIGDLRGTYMDVRKLWVLEGEQGPCPTIRPVTVTVLHVNGSMAAQVETIAQQLSTLADTTLVLHTNSKHVAAWLTGEYRAKSETAKALLASRDGAKSRRVSVIIAA